MKKSLPLFFLSEKTSSPPNLIQKKVFAPFFSRKKKSSPPVDDLAPGTQYILTRPLHKLKKKNLLDLKYTYNL